MRRQVTVSYSVATFQSVTTLHSVTAFQSITTVYSVCTNPAHTLPANVDECDRHSRELQSGPVDLSGPFFSKLVRTIGLAQVATMLTIGWSITPAHLQQRFDDKPGDGSGFSAG